MGLILYFSYSQVLDLVKKEMHPETHQKKRSLLKKMKRRKTRDLHVSHINKRRNKRKRRMKAR